VDYLKQALPEVTRVLMPNIESAYIELIAGRVDAAVHDTPHVQHYANTLGQGRVKVAGKLKSGDQYGIAFPKGSPLVPQVNAALATLKSTGQYEEIYAKWFGRTLIAFREGTH